MVHKSSIIPGLSRFVDENILVHYPANSMKRVIMAGAVSLYLKQNEGVVDSIIGHPLVSSLGVTQGDSMVDIDSIRDTLKREISKVGFMRLSVPMFGDIDFTPEDIDTLYKVIVETNSEMMKPAPKAISAPSPLSSIIGSSGGVY